MESASRQAHWENVYTTKDENEVSWFQQSPAPSLELITQTGATHAPRSSTSAAALHVWSITWSSRDLRTSPCLICQAQRWRPPSGGWRTRRSRHWVVADATAWEPVKAYDIWHDRAAFHFLTEEKDRAAYIARLTQGVKAGGHAIIATFALDGPEKCSGLPVARYDSASLARTLGSRFQLVHTRPHEHTTPWGSQQMFQFSVFRREV